MIQTKIAVGILLVLVIFAGCAPGPNSMADVPYDCTILINSDKSDNITK